MRLVWHSSRRLVGVHLLLTPLIAGLPPLSIYLLRRVVDTTEQIWVQGARTQMEDWRPLFGLLAAAGAVTLTGMLIRPALSWFGQALQFKTDDHVRSVLHSRLLEFDIAFFENPERLNHLYLARDQALRRPMHTVNGLLQLLRGGATAGGIMLLLAAFRWWLPPLLLAGALPGVWLRVRRARKLYHLRQQLIPVEREVSYFDQVLSGGIQAKEMRIYGHGKYFKRRFHELRQEVREAQLKWRMVVLGGELAAQCVALGVVVITLALLGRELLAGATTLGAIAMCVRGIQNGNGALGRMVTGVTGLYEDALFLKGFEDLMNEPVTLRAPTPPRSVPRRIVKGLEIEGVSFTYPGADAPVLRDLSLTLRPGECTLLAGGNGSGKSTLVKLLCRFYDPDQGTIRLDGMDLREMDPLEWRRRLGILFQDFGAYPLSLRENVWFGDAQRPPNDADIEKVLERVDALELARRLPHGLDTRLGRMFKDGEEISIGQWQRLALARALLRDSVLLMLDEPASALDTEAQENLARQIQSIKRDRVVLLISHGPAMMRAVDRVATLEHGCLKELDTPLVLLRRDSIFSRLLAAGQRGADWQRSSP